MQIESIVVKASVLVFLGICAVFDIRKKEIPLILAAAGIITATGAAIWRIKSGEAFVAQILFSLLPGIFFLAVSRCTKEKVGYGDGVLLLIIGLMTGFYRCFFGLCVGLFLSACCGLFLLLIHKAVKESRIPFAPFLTVGMGVCFIL
ncbi:MAG: prepilin peptidase [Clostridium sp.]|nr:prepilin peptidase [Clostridium sp.]